MSIIKKHYNKSEKLAIVNESLEQGVKIDIIAKRYNVHPNTIYKWRKMFEIHQESAFPGRGNTVLTDEQKEIRELRKQLSESHLANEILKKAMGIITSPSRRNLLS